MKYIIVKQNGYIVSVGTGNSGTEISEEKYNEILFVIHNKPKGTTTTDYRLREDLTWEEYEIPPIPEPEPDANEIVDILTGVSE